MMIVAVIVLSTVSVISAGLTICTAIKMHVSMSTPLLFVSIWYQGITCLVKSYFSRPVFFIPVQKSNLIPQCIHSMIVHLLWLVFAFGLAPFVLSEFL